MKDRPCTQRWHFEARRLASQGYSGAEIGRIVGRSRQVVNRFLNPYSHAKRAAQDAANKHRRYATDPDYRVRCIARVRLYQILKDTAPCPPTKTISRDTSTTPTPGP